MHGEFHCLYEQIAEQQKLDMIRHTRMNDRAARTAHLSTGLFSTRRDTASGRQLCFLPVVGTLCVFFLFIMKIVHKVQTKIKTKGRKTKANPYGSSLHAAQ